MHLLKVFITGLFISFLGALPLGTLNIAAMQIAVTDGISPALWFSVGALLVEIIYVRLSLVAMDWVRRQQRLFRWLEILTLLIMVALAIASFVAATRPQGAQNVILSSTLPRFLLGVLMSAINPVQIPFWFGWSTVLFTKKILQPDATHYNLYILGIGLGTFMGNGVFIFSGRVLVDLLNRNSSILHWCIGAIFALTALIQAWRMYRHTDAANQLEHPKDHKMPFEDRIPAEKNKPGT
jgi:threonine/homoserine/homoserine lactone efflux protein